MRTKSLVVAVFVGGLIAAWWLRREALRSGREAEAAVGRLAVQRIALEGELRRAEKRRVEAERGRDGGIRTPGASGGANAGVPVKPSGPPRPAKTVSDLIADDPKAEVLMLRWQRAVVGVEYGPFFRSRGLSPEQIAKFEEGWVKRAERDLDLRAAGRGQDVAGERTVAALKQQAKDEYDAMQRQVLGAEGYAQLKDFERTLVVRNVVVLGLAGTAALEGVPLTAQQGEQLWAAALEATGSEAKGKVSGEALVRQIDWAALDGRAREILTPAQFALFTNVAPPSGFQPRWKYQLDAAISRAKETDAVGAAAPKQPGG